MRQPGLLEVRADDIGIALHTVNGGAMLQDQEDVLGVCPIGCDHAI
jgi:hypothetical protein